MGSRPGRSEQPARSAASRTNLARTGLPIVMPPGSPQPMRRPSSADLADAANRTIPDVIAPSLEVLFVGINPGLWSGATGRHFARPGNRFWKAIWQAGLTSELLSPDRQADLLGDSLGITNLVPRTTATAAELSVEELRKGAEVLIRTVATYRPRKLAFLGVSSYRIAFDRPRASVGRQSEAIEDAEVWVLP